MRYRVLIAARASFTKRPFLFVDFSGIAGRGPVVGFTKFPSRGGLVIATQAVRKPFDLLPFVIGVTGHRDPPAEAEAPLRGRFREVLEELRRQHPSTELVVLSGLAAGADIWAAEEALALGIAVFGCLPMPQTEYEKDFAAGELERFRSVLSKCSATFVVGASEVREQGYVDVADFIAYYCHVLVAFWDGLPARGRGGTADVVDLRRGGLPSVVGDALVAYMPDVGPVFQIVTPRKGQPPPPGCYSLHEMYPERARLDPSARKTAVPAGEQEFDDAIAHLERFDRDLAREEAPSGPNRLAALCTRTDAAANRQQTKMVLSMQSLYVVTALAGAAQLVLPTDGSFGIPGWAGTAARFGLLVVAFVVFAIAKRSDYENRYQDYRAIAEALRVQYAWCCAGLRRRLVEASYLQMQQNELEWIRLALRTAYLVVGEGTATGDDSPSHPESKRWVEGQLQYYRQAGKRELEQLQRSQHAMIGVAVVGLVLSATAGAVAWALTHGWLSAPADQGPAVLRMLTYWSTMPFALGGMFSLLIRFYAQQRGFAENARRYQHMSTVFAAASDRLRSRTGDPSKVLEQLGHEALSEHANWLILHRERPLTLLQT
jgi:hypothetical protein